MQLANRDIDRIVEEVVRRLLAVRAKTDVAGTSEQEGPDALVLRDRLITLATLENKLPTDARRLSVPQRAVVTPAAHDLLRDKGVTLERHMPAKSDGALLAIARLGATCREAWSQLTSQQDATPLPGQSAPSLIRRLEASVRSGEFSRSVLLAEHPLAVACLCNRHPALRAAAARSSSDVAAARESFDANVLVLGRLPAAEVAALARQFATAAPGRALPPYQEQTS